MKGDVQAYLMLCLSETKVKLEISEVMVVRDFPDVFVEINSLPLERDIEYPIDLIPGIGPISIAPYCMSPLELK